MNGTTGSTPSNDGCSRASAWCRPRRRARLVRGIERARLGEKRAWLAACAAALFAALSVRVTLPVLDAPSGARPRVVAPSELEALGFDSTEAARMARVLSSASVIRLAPIPSNGASLSSFHVSR